MNKLPVKILYLITDLNIGGAEQLLLLMLKNLNRQKYDPTVCCFYAGELAGEIKSLGIRVIDLKMESKLDLLVLFKLLNLLKKEKFDIVHTHLFHANIAGRLIARLCGVPIVISTLHYAFSYNGKFGILLERLTARLADKIIVVSGAVKKFCLNEICIPENKLQFIYNGVDLDMNKKVLTSSARLKEQLSLNNEFIIGCIGRFDKVKGHAYLLKAVAEITKVYTEIKILLAGAGSLENQLRDLADELGISKYIIFLKNRRDIPQILDLFDVYVLPSLQEGLSITLLEAISMGKPSVVTAVGGNPEVIVDGESGMLVPPKDHRIMAEVIIRLLENKSMAEQLGANARLRAMEKFDIKENVYKTESLYNYLLEKSGKPDVSL